MLTEHIKRVLVKMTQDGQAGARKLIEKDISLCGGKKGSLSRKRIVLGVCHLF